METPEARIARAAARSKGAKVRMARYGAKYVAANARSGIMTKAYAEAGLTPDTMRPDLRIAFERQVIARNTEKARAGKAAKRALRLAEAAASETTVQS